MQMSENEKFVPTIVAFCCNWCSYAGADLSGTNRLQYPANVKIIRVPCSCRVNPMFILRAFHVAGRCTDCGECSRVCPEHIPLHLLNRKFIKDIDELYGDYTAGTDTESRHPLTSYTFGDAEPSVVHERGVE